MGYIKNLVFNFFLVFFSNYLIPGIDVVNQSKIPHIRGDLIFAGSLGLLNSLISPLFRVFNAEPGILQRSFCALILNFAAYALLRFIAIGVFVTDIEGYLTASILVTVGSFLLNFASRTRSVKKNPETSEESPLEESHNSNHDNYY